MTYPRRPYDRAALLAAIVVCSVASAREARAQSSSCARPLPAPAALDERVPEYIVTFHDSVDVVRAIVRAADRYGVAPSRIYRGPVRGFVAALDSAGLAGLRCDPAVRWIEPSRILCLGIAKPAVVVAVSRATDDSAVTADVTGVVRDGAYVDSLRLGDEMVQRAGFLSGAIERAGTYTIELHLPGYHPWVRAGVRVVRGACNVETVHLAAVLVPLQAP